MSNIPPALKLNIRPRILFQVAKAAWEGKLFERQEDICRMIKAEFEDKTARQYVTNQIRIAMGLSPHDSDEIINDYDEEALMGMGSEPIVVANPDACRLCLEPRACEQHCPVGAISHDETGRLKIDHTRCLGDGTCIGVCEFGALAQKSQFVPLINLLKQHTHPVYASVAPAFAGQFGPGTTPGKLRTALLKLGFTDMVETALYADLVTIKEAFEFNDHVKTDRDFMITSCCCPIWIKLVENKFPELVVHISPSVSPMIASGRVIKTLEPEAKVVFIGPCVAKKSEALLPDLKGAIDYVLTFQELSTIFAAAAINPADETDEENATASWGGRLYGRTGGVSSAVAATLVKLVPRRAQSLKAIKVDGIPDCQKLLTEIKAGKIDANFIEGMACKGGCVGGPGRIIPSEEGTRCVNEYSILSHAQTPVENPHIYAVLARLGGVNIINGDGSNIPAMTGENPMAAILSRKLTTSPADAKALVLPG
ncbi:MAG TPA: [Fe-Fe] hydrogenase large subunit C-terminal domain-containing protein [Methylomusa anaerophila]|uniref:Iron hydrogenase 1 n=1 Tax=Methylomusa anaerophila TaxID=1930071 RepID=A0A348ANK1_9FIRM|nr:[Fe-Fe] hydrogenase large subunit C-terminal domain-containing protein [Methylomusa anaerophila]BBB92649.1 iron hydrogenase 1 [Methylomusa anaerophila]HML87498.1 [Fe-Fe] hydrogenase large subunit C-terminal domain-containing protein [Methylomusa anaerophila]